VSWADNVPVPYPIEPPRYEKPYPRGRTTLDAKCFCGKLCTEYVQYKQHVHAKHPKLYRRMKKTGEWKQLEIDWVKRDRGTSMDKAREVLGR
jgi:hypothetical protein